MEGLSAPAHVQEKNLSANSAHAFLQFMMQVAGTLLTNGVFPSRKYSEKVASVHKAAR